LEKSFLLLDKAGGVSFDEIQEFMKARKNTLDVLILIIDGLEKYGKMQTTCSLIASGIKVASGILWLTAPQKSITVVADVAASGLNIADLGVSLLAAWKENGLLDRAAKICKKDFDIFCKISFWYSKLASGVELSRASPLTFKNRIKDGWKVCRDGKPQDYAYKPTKKAAGLSILANLPVFINQIMRVYEGNYSSVATQLKLHLESLQKEYDKLTIVSKDELAAIYKATQSV
jgi:hypothetical protein